MTYPLSLVNILTVLAAVPPGAMVRKPKASRRSYGACRAAFLATLVPWCCWQGDELRHDATWAAALIQAHRRVVAAVRSAYKPTRVGVVRPQPVVDGAVVAVGWLPPR